MLQALLWAAGCGSIFGGLSIAVVLLMRENLVLRRQRDEAVEELARRAGVHHPGGATRARAYSVDPDGTIAWGDGTKQHVDGTVTWPDGSRTDSLGHPLTVE